jgi:hypothetical protein
MNHIIIILGGFSNVHIQHTFPLMLAVLILVFVLTVIF